MVHQNVRIHPTAIVEDSVTIGAGTSVWDNVHKRAGAVIGEQCIVGEKTYIAGDTKIGNRVKINAYVYIPACVTVEDGVMIAAHTVFTNDQFPRACNLELTKLLPSAVDENTRPTLVQKGSTIGAKCTIGNNLTIGKFAMVGMGAVVTKSVENFQMVVGVPAKAVALVCRCGYPLHSFEKGPMTEGQSLDCRMCGWKFEVTGFTLKDLGPRGRSASFLNGHYEFT